MSAVRLAPAVIARRYNFVIQRLRLIASALTAWTFHISTIATEQDADVHFVSLRFEPAKETADSVPAIVLVIVIGVFAPTFLTVNDKILIGLGQFVERRMHIDLLASTRPQQILLGFAHFLPAKNAHHPLPDRERSVRNRAIQINRDGATEPTAFRAGAKRIIEAEKPRRRRADVEVAMRAMPAGGEWVLVTGSGGRVGRRFRNCRRHIWLHRKRNDVDFAITETKRCLDGLS